MLFCDELVVNMAYDISHVTVLCDGLIVTMAYDISNVTITCDELVVTMAYGIHYDIAVLTADRRGGPRVEWRMNIYHAPACSTKLHYQYEHHQH